MTLADAGYFAGKHVAELHHRASGDAGQGPANGPSVTGALLDRLTHHVHIIEMNGDSYRLRQSSRTACRDLSSPS